MKNIVVLTSEISTQDLLLLLRNATKKLCHLEYLFVNSRGNGETVLAKEPNEINFEEFTYLLTRRRNAVEVMVDRK